MPDLFPSAAHDAGGKRFLRWPSFSIVRARFGGPGECYRYELSEIWDVTRPLVMWLMMNPSIASVQFSDPTLAKTGRFTRRLRSSDGGVFGGQLIANVHAFRATDRMRLTYAKDPVGPENDEAILLMAGRAEMIVLAYGQPPKELRTRGREVAARLWNAGFDVRVLRQSRDGTPMHPLYIKENTLPQRVTAIEAIA